MSKNKKVTTFYELLKSYLFIVKSQKAVIEIAKTSKPFTVKHNQIG
jgi:hypothetical protein